VEKTVSEYLLRKLYAAATFLTRGARDRHFTAPFQPFLLRRNMVQKRHLQIAGRPGIG
jgi:hypothetical protein